MTWFRSKKSKAENNPLDFINDQLSIRSILAGKATLEELQQFHWEYYSYLAHQRSKIAEVISAAIFEAADQPFNFKKWQRVVKYKYCLNPLSMRGSLNDIAGGRFNIGNIDKTKFTPSPCLYIAKDKITAQQEMLCAGMDTISPITPFEYALTNPQSILNVSVSGYLDSVIDLTNPKRLEPFVDLIKGFSIPQRIRDEHKRIHRSELIIIDSVDHLIAALLYPNWREWPTLLDVPFSSQIFGQIVSTAKVEGILYPSKYTNAHCLAIFPQNFDTSSYVKLDDPAPAGIRHKILDILSWQDLCQ